MSSPSQVAEGGSRRKALVLGSGLQAISQVLLLVINLILTPYVIAGFGPERFSIYLLVASICLLMSTLDGGVGAAAQRFFTIYAGSGDIAARSRLMASLVGLTTLSTLCIFPFLLIFAPSIVSYFHVAAEYRDETIFLMRSLAALTGILIVRNLFNSLLFAHRRFVITASAAMVSHFIFAGGMIASVQFKWGLYGVAGTLIAVQVFVSAVNVPFALRLLDRHHFGWFGKERFREFLGYAWKLQVSSMITLIAAQKDQLVAGRLLGAQLSGPYGQGSNLAAQLVRMPMNALSPMQSVIGQDVGRLGEENSLQRTELLQRVWVRLSTVWLALGAPVVYVGVRAWLPDSYDLAGSVATILVVGLFFQLATTVLRLWCLTVGRPGLELESLAMGLAVNVIASIGLYPVLGMLGVIAGTAVSHAFVALYMQWRATRVLESPLRSFLREIPVPALVVISAITTGLALLAESHLPHGFLGIVTAALLALPGVAIAFFWLVPAAERRRLWRRLRRTPPVDDKPTTSTEQPADKAN